MSAGTEPQLQPETPDLPPPQGQDLPEQPAIEEQTGKRSRLMKGISRNVFVLGVVSFFTDVSSEMIIPVRILFLVGVLHTPLAVAGLIEAFQNLAAAGGLDRQQPATELTLIGWKATYPLFCGAVLALGWCRFRDASPWR